MNFIHPTVNKQEFIDKFLSNYGDVLDHFPGVTARYGVPDGSYTFIMKEDDLAKNQLQESVFINKVQSFIAYRTQEQTCFNCGQTGHNSNDCPDKEYVAFPHLGAGNGEQGKKINPFLPGVLLPTKQQVTNNRRKLNRFQMNKVQVPPAPVVSPVPVVEIITTEKSKASVPAEKDGNGSGDDESEAGDDASEAGEKSEAGDDESEASDDDSKAGDDESEAGDEEMEDNVNPDEEMKEENLEIGLVEEVAPETEHSGEGFSESEEEESIESRVKSIPEVAKTVVERVNGDDDENWLQNRKRLYSPASGDEFATHDKKLKDGEGTLNALNQGANPPGGGTT